MVADLISRNVRDVHVLAWRDLADPDAGGSEIHADEFMRRWQNAGLNVLHRTSRAQGHESECRRNGYRVIRRGGRFGVFPRTMLSEIFRNMGSYDAVVEIWNGVPWMSPVWCRKPRIAVLHHVHDRMWDQIMPAPLSWFGKKLEMSVAPPVYRKTPVVTLCDDSRRDLLELGWPSSKIHVAHAGVDPFFSPGGRKTPHPSVVAVGRLAPVKRFQELLNQFLDVRRRVPAATLTIVGEGPERGRLEQWIRDNDAHSWARLAGRVERDVLLDLYRSSWLILSTSLAEGWGLTLTEAAGCGTPAVATDIGGHRSSVKDSETGVLLPLERIGEGCAELLLHDETRTEMGRRARAWARTLSWDRLAREVLQPLHETAVR